MATVDELLDQLAAGKTTLAEVAADFARRAWPTPPAAGDSKARAWGVADDDAPAPDSFAAVSTDPRLTAEQYATLAKAYQAAIAARR